MKLYEAIFKRRSIRSYQMDPLPAYLLENIRDYEAELEPLTEGISVQLEVLDNTEKGNTVKGLFSIKAPYYLVLHSEEKTGYLENAGYLLEQMVLYLTRKGLGTCYLGNARPKETEKADGEMTMVIVLAFGYADNKKPAGKVKRKQMSELCVFKNEPKKTMLEIMESARIAPSSVNSQPWRFVVYDNRIHVFMRKSGIGIVLQRWDLINIGIVLAHIMIAAEELWYETTITKLDNITSKTVQKNEYLYTVLLTKTVDK